MMISIFLNAVDGNGEKKRFPVYGNFDNPLFLADNVGEICGADVDTMTNLLATWEDNRYAFKMRLMNPNATVKQRKTHEKWVLTEAGLTRFAFSSQSEECRKFQDWVCLTVAPSIRTTGAAVFFD